MARDFPSAAGTARESGTLEPTPPQSPRAPCLSVPLSVVGSGKAAPISEPHYLTGWPALCSHSPTMRQFLTIREAAQLLAVSRGTLRSLLGRGMLPFTRCGRSVRIDPEDLEVFLRANRVPASARASLRKIAAALGRSIDLIRTAEGGAPSEDWRVTSRLSQVRVELERVRQGFPVRLECLERVVALAPNLVPDDGGLSKSSRVVAEVPV